MKLLTIKQFCGLTGVSRFTCYKLMKAGTIRAVRIGRSVRIPDEEYQRLLAVPYNRPAGEAA